MDKEQIAAEEKAFAAKEGDGEGTKAERYRLSSTYHNIPASNVEAVTITQEISKIR